MHSCLYGVLIYRWPMESKQRNVCVSSKFDKSRPLAQINLTLRAPPAPPVLVSGLNSTPAFPKQAYKSQKCEQDGPRLAILTLYSEATAFSSLSILGHRRNLDGPSVPSPEEIADLLTSPTRLLLPGGGTFPKSDSARSDAAN